MKSSSLMPPDLFSQVPKVLSVTELTQGVKCLLEEGFSSVCVAGEISSLSRPSSGHIYLSLKDSQAQIRGVLWRSTAARVPFKLAEGQEVIARGKITVYAPRGDYQLQIDDIQPKGIGALELALRQLKEKLSRLGYFAPERKRVLPRFPRRLALVTSPSGAAVRDMLETLRMRWPAVEVLVCPVRVQGDGAAQEIAGTIRLLNKLHDARHLLFDVMIVGRGGGSTEDLWAFNEECVAHAIFQSCIPVVSAVGHEIDWTIADGVADCRALTPTDAAGRVVPDRMELMQALLETEARLRESLLARLEQMRTRLADLSQRPAFRRPLDRIRDLERRCDDWADRLNRSIKQRLLAAGERVTGCAGRLHSLSPLNVLGRGYSVTKRAMDHVVVRDPSQVRPGDRLLTLVQNGRVLSCVEEVETAPPPETRSRASP